MGALTDGRAPGFMEGSMTHPSRRVPRALLAVGLVAVSAAAAAPARAAVTPVAWHGCNDAIGLECALYSVPRDYSQSSGPSLQLSLVRMPAADSAHRIGSLFVNFGGPGASGVDGVKLLGDLFAALNQRFDIVGFDPRGTGESSAAVDCHVNQETQGVYAQPFATPENLGGGGSLVARDNAYVQRCIALNGAILPYLSTANVARDLDVLRQAVGDDKLNYLGFSYGTFLGATYASMFPRNYRALVLDGALDADQYINHPLEATRAQTAGFERAIGRFLQACATHQSTCAFGADPTDPWT